MKTGDILALAGLGIAGVIGYKTLSGTGGISMPEVKMPEIKMPDFTVLMPDIKLWPEGLKMPTVEEFKEIFAAPLAGITGKIPTLDDIKGAMPEWFGDPIPYLKEQTPEELTKFLSDPWGYIKENSPEEFKKFADDPGGYIGDAVKDAIPQEIMDTAGSVNRFIRDPVGTAGTYLGEAAGLSGAIHTLQHEGWGGLGGLSKFSELKYGKTIPWIEEQLAIPKKVITETIPSWFGAEPRR